jgi:hypothetical protein
MPFSQLIAERGVNSPYDALIAGETGGDYLLTLFTKAIICVESGWDPSATNPSDPSVGLMAVTVGAAQDNGYAGDLNGLYDPATNIHYGVAYLKTLMARFGLAPDMTTSLASAYNAGHPARLTRGGFSNQQYVDDVNTYYVWYVNNLPGRAAGPSPAAPPGTPATATGIDPATGALTDAGGAPITAATDTVTGGAVDLASISVDPATGNYAAPNGDPVALATDAGPLAGGLALPAGALVALGVVAALALLLGARRGG